MEDFEDNPELDEELLAAATDVEKKMASADDQSSLLTVTDCDEPQFLKNSKIIYNKYFEWTYIKTM